MANGLERQGLSTGRDAQHALPLNDFFSQPQGAQHNDSLGEDDEAALPEPVPQQVLAFGDDLVPPH
jgi:hypothetical protein